MRGAREGEGADAGKHRSSLQPCAQHGQQDPHGIAEAAVRDAAAVVWAVQAGHGWVLLSAVGRWLMMAEGDVDGIMERPDGNGEQDQRAREKWCVGTRPHAMG